MLTIALIVDTSRGARRLCRAHRWRVSRTYRQGTLTAALASPWKATAVPGPLVVRGLSSSERAIGGTPATEGRGDDRPCESLSGLIDTPALISRYSPRTWPGLV